MKAIAKQWLSRETRLSLRRAYYAGSKFECNVCGCRVRRLLPSGYDLPVLRKLDVIGGETISDDRCPVCFSNGRTRLLSEYVKKEIVASYEDAADFKVLHIAPEYAIYAFLRQIPKIVYVAGDVDPISYKQSQDVVFCDITKMDFDAASFDVIICSHVLEHVPNDRLAMSEILRVLRPGGIALLQVPISSCLMKTIEDPEVTDPRERERRFGQHDHVRIYGADYVDRLTMTGFAVEIFDPAQSWGESAIQAFRLNPREKLYIGRKRESVAA